MPSVPTNSNSSTEVSGHDFHLKQQDPFLFFSNSARRMRHLFGAPGQELATSNHEPVVERKSRISFELHYSVILDDILSELDGVDTGENDDFIEELLFGSSLTGDEHEADENRDPFYVNS